MIVVCLASCAALGFPSVPGHGDGTRRDPLFAVGATFGATLGRALGPRVPLMAAIGFVSVFAGATKTPIACTIMGVELFGAAAAAPVAIVWVVAYGFRSGRGIDSTQRVAVPESGDVTGATDNDSVVVTLGTTANQRRPWLPVPLVPSLGQEAAADRAAKPD